MFSTYYILCQTSYVKPFQNPKNSSLTLPKAADLSVSPSGSYSWKNTFMFFKYLIVSKTVLWVSFLKRQTF